MASETTRTTTGTPIRYVPLRELYKYSAVSPPPPCSPSECGFGSSSNSTMSKKVKARKPQPQPHQPSSSDIKLPPPPPPPPLPLPLPPPSSRPPLIYFYTRQKRPRHSFNSQSTGNGSPSPSPSPSRSLEVVAREEKERVEAENDDDGVESRRQQKKRHKKKGKFGTRELINLGADAFSSRVLRPRLDGPLPPSPRLREHQRESYSLRSNRSSGGPSENCRNLDDSQTLKKRWVGLSFDSADPKKFIGLQCKVYWPLDDDWYTGRVVGYTAETGRHQVSYEDGDEENIILSNERIKFYLARSEVDQLNLCYSIKNLDTDGLDFDEMVVLAASFDDSDDLGPGDIIWAKITGHAMWPAIVVDESLLGNCKGLNRNSGGRSVPVQFFGTHDFARVNMKQVISFLRGLLSSFHLKCKKPQFIQSLEEAKMYLSEQKLPKGMLRMRNGIEAADCDRTSQEDEYSVDSIETFVGDKGKHGKLGGLKTCPFEIGDLQVLSLGKIVKDSEYFQDEGFIWPEGYTAVRKFPSITDPSVCASYKMEVLRDVDSRTRPLFRVTLDNGEQFKGSTPSTCWNKIYRRMKKINNSSDGFIAESGFTRITNSGSDLFGFSNPEVLKLIRELSNSKLPPKSSLSKFTSQRSQDLPIGYRPVHVRWKDLDKCNVCHMDEEYENNVFLQCDKCRMMVHARCYGESEPVDGVLWLCNLCRPGAPDFPPPCCLCPVIGGAMKRTTDGRWAHLACAMWIPETCLANIKTMEPIDGLSRIHKDRWKLLCSICGVSYGACVQCSKNTCRVAYHPLCARAAGFCVELEDEDRLHLASMDEDEDEQCIRLLSFCKKHRPSSTERLTTSDQIVPNSCQFLDYSPPSNPSGCARSEPYNYFGRRGRKEPEALAAASMKRLYVENRPYLVGGWCQHEALGNTPSTSFAGCKFSFSLQKLKTSQLEAPRSILSMAEKYEYMKETVRKRLTFGKSGIHGFGIFAKQPHRAGDMVIEYAGELVRPPVADRREHLIYNSLVGAGTYMFRIDDERVVDATRAGSIAHLINHSCEPNCYSRFISVNGDEHIIIFAKRDIEQWEELTYDYRFLSVDVQLACYCGFPSCRGVVNDVEAQEQVAKLCVSRRELVDWRGE